MKKFITVLLTLALFCAVSAGALAAEGEFDTAHDLFCHWEENGYPDYVCGVWSADGSVGNLVIALQDTADGSAAISEILDLIKDDTSVSFETQTYSHNYLLSIMDELNETFIDADYAQRLGFSSAGIYMDNTVHIEFSEEMQDNEETAAFVSSLESRYGGAVNISYTQAVYDLVGGTLVGAVEDITMPIAPADTGKGGQQHWYLYAAVILLAFGGAAVLLRGRAAAQTTVGTVEAETAASLEQQVRDSGFEVPRELDEKVMAAIETADKE